jgi:hypothetical protein
MVLSLIILIYVNFYSSVNCLSYTLFHIYLLNSHMSYIKSKKNIYNFILNIKHASSIKNSSWS